ncbi:MAG: hypothetical protein AB1505_18140 [Candidatus Latescibacterota bacterium]
MSSVLAAVATALLCLATLAGAAEIGVRRADGSSAFSAEVGSTVELEVVVDAQGEELTGWAFHVSYDGGLFRLVPAGGSGEGATPFVAGGFLGGITLVNRLQALEDEVLLSYTEVLGEASRPGATGSGVAARFRLEAVRRSPAGAAQIRVESRGHDWRSRYVTRAAPGSEQEFARRTPASVQLVGFRILPLPNVTLIDGESSLVFDLDAFVDTTAGQVVWSASHLSEVPTVIDARTREVTMAPAAGTVGRWGMVFTAFESTEGMTAADTVAIRVISRPAITARIPDTLSFPEDGAHPGIDLDAFVTDADDPPSALGWTAASGPQVHAAVDTSSHIVTLRAEPDFFGSEEVLFTVSDGDGLSDTARVEVVVTPVNDPPEAWSPPPVYPVWGQGPVRLPLGDLAADRDDPLAALTFELRPDPGVEVRVEGGDLLVEGTEPGRHLVQIAVTDTSGAAAATRLVSVVLPPGESLAPQIGRLGGLRLLGGQGEQVDLGAWVTDDAPADSLTWSATADTTLRLVQQDGQLRVSAQNGFLGRAPVLLTVTDPQGNSDSGVLWVEVLDPTGPVGPAIADPGKIGLREAEGRTYLDLDSLASDPDDRDEDLTWDGVASVGLGFDPGTGEVSLDTTTPLVSPAAVTLRVTDRQGNTAERTVPVLVAGPGDPPQVGELPSMSLDSLQAEARLDLDDYAFDDEDRESELVWTVTVEPGVTATVDPASHVLRVRRSDLIAPAPAATQVLLRVEDTAGQSTALALRVGLPPLFVLEPVADLELAPGQPDTSLLLDEHARRTPADMELAWTVGATRRLDVGIDPLTHRVRFTARDPSFQGSETVGFTATDPTGRSATLTVRVIMRGRGLTPQVRQLPAQEIVAGTVMPAVDLDDFVADDDPDSLLTWTVSGQRSLAVLIDPATRQVTLDAAAAVPGTETLEFLVRDRADNAATGVMEVLVLRGGQPPVFAPLPQILLLAGGPEQRLDLAPFASDGDTPLSELRWSVAAGQGVAARLEGSTLVVSVPVGQAGLRTARVTLADPQGNQRTAEVQIIADQDSEPPVLRVDVARHQTFGELIEVSLLSSEVLPQAPQVRVDTLLVSVEDQGGGRYRALFPFPPQEEERLVRVGVRAVDRGGNAVSRLVEVVLRWMAQGGEVRAADPQVLLNVPQAASGAGHLALVYRLGEEEKPPDSGPGVVYSVDLLRGRTLAHPVALNFFAAADPDLGILRWNGAAGGWEAVPTQVDAEHGWLSATLNELGLFRLGTVASELRQAARPLRVYPQPLGRDAADGLQIVYQVPVPGRIVVRVYNLLGQPVRLLVDEGQGVGTWSARWNGRDEGGRPVSNGVYFLRLDGAGLRLRQPLVVVR